MVIKTNLKMIHFNIIIKSRRHFLGSVGVRESVRGPFFTRHPFIFSSREAHVKNLNNKTVPGVMQGLGKY